MARLQKRRGMTSISGRLTSPFSLSLSCVSDRKFETATIHSFIHSASIPSFNCDAPPSSGQQITVLGRYSINAVACTAIDSSSIEPPHHAGFLDRRQGRRWRRRPPHRRQQTCEYARLTDCVDFVSSDPAVLYSATLETCVSCIAAAC